MVAGKVRKHSFPPSSRPRLTSLSYTPTISLKNPVVSESTGKIPRDHNFVWGCEISKFHGLAREGTRIPRDQFRRERDFQNSTVSRDCPVSRGIPRDFHNGKNHEESPAFFPMLPPVKRKFDFPGDFMCIFFLIVLVIS